jgi:hypothetical protein
MSSSFIRGIDRQIWVLTRDAPNAHATGVSLACDLRNDDSRHPFIFQLVSNTVLNRYHTIQKAWNLVQSPALAGTYGAGAGALYAPSLGVVGTIGAGCTTSTIVTSTTLTSVGANMLANRGDSRGFYVRIIGYASGKTEERRIVGNTAGTTPTFTLDYPLSFTPAENDRYEILSGRVFMLGAGTVASNSWRSFEVATNTLSSGLSTTGLPATVNTDFSAIAFDEQYVPYDREPGEGFLVGTGTYDSVGASGYYTKNCLTATASAAGTLTGQASGGDAAVLENEYRNFQIRIVEDTSAPTAVGQRRVIASHTAGASPVYTLGTNWTVMPSANAKYVIEGSNLILLFSSGTGNTYTWNYADTVNNNGTNTINANAWSTAYFAVRGANMAAGCTTFPSYGIIPDAAKNARHSYVYSFRGGNTATLDLFDIAGGTTGAWTNAIVYDGGVNLNTGSCGKYAPGGNEGRFGYLNAYVASQVTQVYRFDVKHRTLNPVTPTDWLQAGTAAVGDRVATYAVENGNDVYSVILLLFHLSGVSAELVIQT